MVGASISSITSIVPDPKIVPCRSRKWPPVLKRTGACEGCAFCGANFSPLFHIPDAPWCWNMYTYIYPKNHPNVGKYSSTMEHLGMVILNDILWMDQWRIKSWTHGCFIGFNPGGCRFANQLKTSAWYKTKNMGFCHLAWQCSKIGGFHQHKLVVKGDTTYMGCITKYHGDP